MVDPFRLQRGLDAQATDPLLSFLLSRVLASGNLTTLEKPSPLLRFSAPDSVRRNGRSRLRCALASLLAAVLDSLDPSIPF
jgi:hypothetical protein